MTMPDAFNRWSQIVRRPGAVEIQAHHAIDVPAISDELPYSDPRPGTRLLVRPIEGDDLPWTIDVTSTQAQAMLEGFLRSGNHVGLRLSWRSRGFGTRRKDTIHLRPVRPDE
jgi:hypothetical protein